ncbi:hypothetical protein [Campylobacter ureolyticus]|uniref:hypothetical protein n=1 Tax=Campylobacter ureolyticus TaxID=827 RepID=UPI001FC89D27|nr:hypothetical protein [Campylobacter ureolyticus]
MAFFIVICALSIWVWLFGFKWYKLAKADEKENGYGFSPFNAMIKIIFLGYSAVLVFIIAFHLL